MGRQGTAQLAHLGHAFQGEGTTRYRVPIMIWDFHAASTPLFDREGN